MLWHAYWVWTGLVVGSFLNVVAYRLPLRWKAKRAGQTDNLISVSSPKRSFCPTCRHQILWYQNIPVVSYILLRGRCAGCHQRIHWRYFLVEAIMGLIYGTTVLTMPLIWAIPASIGSTLIVTAILLFLPTQY